MKCDYCDEEATWESNFAPLRYWCQYHHEMWTNLDVPPDIWELVMLTVVAEDALDKPPR